MMNGFCHQLLSGATLPFDEDADFTVTHLFQQPHDLLNLFTGTQDVLGSELALDFSPQLGILLQQFVPVLLQVLEELCRFDGNGRIGCQSLHDVLILAVEGALLLIQDFEGTDDLPVVVF